MQIKYWGVNNSCHDYRVLIFLPLFLLLLLNVIFVKNDYFNHAPQFFFPGHITYYEWFCWNRNLYWGNFCSFSSTFAKNEQLWKKIYWLCIDCQHIHFSFIQNFIILLIPFKIYSYFYKMYVKMLITEVFPLLLGNNRRLFIFLSFQHTL